MSEYYLGGHIRDRFCERTAYKTKSEQDAVAEDTIKNGLKLKSFSSAFYDFLNTKQFSCGLNTVLVNVDLNLIFIVNTNAHKFCTVYDVPEEFRPVSNFIRKEAGQRCFVAICEKDGTYEFIGESASGLVEDVADATEFRSHESAQNCIKNNKNVARRVMFGAEVEVVDL